VTSKWSFCGLRRGDKHIDVLLLQDNCRNKTVGKIAFTLLLLCTLMAYSGLCSGGGGSLFPIFLDLFHKILKILGGGLNPEYAPVFSWQETISRQLILQLRGRGGGVTSYSQHIGITIQVCSCMIIVHIK